MERLNLNEIKKLFKWPLGDIKSNRRSTSHIERRIIIRLISSGMKLKDAKEIVGITSGSICEWSEYKDGYKKNKNTYPPLCNVTDFCDEEKSVNIEWEDNIVNNYTLEELKEKYNWPEGEKNGSKRVYSADEKQGIIRLAVSKGWSVRDVSRVAGVSMGALYGWPEFKQRDTHKSKYKPIQTEVITDVDHALSEPAYIKTPKSSTSLHTISESKVNQELSGVTDTQENISSLDISGSNFNKVAGTQGGDIHPAINKLIIVVLDVLEKMAKDAAKELPDKTRKNQTTAMGLSYDGKLYLASSTKHLSLKQQAWAKRYRVKIKSGLPDERDSGYHAEERLIIYEPPMRFINPDRLICIDCEKAMKRNGVRFSVEGTKSKSKKRIVGIDLSTDNYASKLKSNSGINNGGHFKLLAPIDSPLNVLRNKVIFNVSYLGSLQELSNDERLKGWDRVFNWLKKHSFDQENLEDVMSVLAENGFIIPTEMYVAVLLRFRQLHVMESSLKPD
ncbi:hypothetical protein CEQ31_000305 [Serratia odorifera]|nr:hypothetical protein CEQ31_000305 [Serratia odorifera]